MSRFVTRQRTILAAGGCAVGALCVTVYALASHQPGAVESLTGCLNPRGGLNDVAIGDTPLRPCNPREVQVHLRGGSTIPAARVSASAPISIAHDVLTVLPLDVEEFDTANLHNPTTQNSQLVAPVEGLYQVSGHVSWPLSSAGARELFLSANIGVTFKRIASSVLKSSDVSQTHQSVSTVIKLSAGDYVQMEVRQTSGIGDVVQLSDHSPVLAMAWLGPG